MLRLIVFLVVLASTYGYLGLRLSPGLGWSVWLALAVLIGGVGLYPLTFRRASDVWTKTLRLVIHLDMAFLSFLASLVIVRDLLFVPFLWFKPDWGEVVFSASGSLAVIALTCVGVAVGFWNAVSGPKVKNVEVPIADLPRELEGYTIAQISDLHVGPTIGREYVDRVVEKVSSLGPHLTVLTGDIADGSADEFREEIAPLRKLSESNAALYVPGNHEYYWNGPRWISEFEALGFKALLNSRTIMVHEQTEILVAGVVDPAARIANPMARPDAQAAHGPPSEAPLKILLSHHPGIARKASELGFHLQLSGHTHAGQFFPWTFVVRRVHEFAHGLKACGRMWVYVNPGTGSWGPPIRLGTATEITLLRLKRA